MRTPSDRTLRIEDGCLVIPIELISAPSYKASFDVGGSGVASLEFRTTPPKFEELRKELVARYRPSKPIEAAGE